eukprot:jgi/Botrbrau1/23661/Bobra.55_2s0044.1
MSETVTILCGDTSSKQLFSHSGLRCRFSDGEVPANFDEESSRLCCKRSVSQGSFSTVHDIVGKDGKIILGQQKGELMEGPKEAILPGQPEEPPISAIKAEDEPDEVSGSAILKKLSWIDRFLYIWILLAMAAGILIGEFVRPVPQALNRVEIVTVSLPITLGLWLMMWPVLTKVQYDLLGTLLKDGKVWKKLLISCFLNWIVGPMLMTGLAWATLPDLPGYRTGIIVIGLARCIAMVLIWNHLAGGSAELCAFLVAINSCLQVVLFSPMALFYLNVVSRGAGVSIGFWPIARSVLIFLGVPLVGGILTRYLIIWSMGRRWLDTKFMPYFGPMALVGLLYTIFIMFSSQSHAIISNIGAVARTAVPMVLYFGIIFTLSMVISRLHKDTYEIAVTQAFTASGNNFELAIAVAVGTWGITSQEALAATVGPLIEVPVLVGMVYVSLWIRKKLKWE